MSTRPEYEPLAPVIRLAPEPTPPDPYKRADRKRRLLSAVVAGTLLAVVVLLAAWTIRSAAGHYERGREALVAERYSAAIQEFNAARVVVFSYRDAEALAAEAADALNKGMRQESVSQGRLEAAVSSLVRRADAALLDGDARAAARALTDARERVPEGRLAEDPLTLVLLRTLSQRLAKAYRLAIDDGRWAVATSAAAGLSAIDPDDDDARRWGVKARRGADLQVRLDEARAAARRGKWLSALRTARDVNDAWPGFPGAVSLIAEAKAALAPKPKPSPTATPIPPAPTPTAPSKPTPPPP